MDAETQHPTWGINIGETSQWGRIRCLGGRSLHTTRCNTQIYVGVVFNVSSLPCDFCCKDQEAPKKKVMDVNPIFWFGGPWPPPPIPITQYPHPDKKGTNLLLFMIGIHLHTYQDLKLKCCRIMGQKLRYRRPCTRDLGTHNWLAVPHCFHFFRIPLNISLR
jgi:hypothetical protein